jgi:hypothetical protein
MQSLMQTLPASMARAICSARWSSADYTELLRP